MTTRAPELNTAKYHRVGVISLMGYQVQAKSVGWWAFANKGWEGDVRNAQLNEKSRDLMTASLKRRGFDAVPISYDAIDWYERYKRRTQGLSLSSLLSAYGADVVTGEFKTELTQLARDQHLDGFVIFVPGRDTTRQTGEAWVGVGDTGFGISALSQGELKIYVMGSLYLVDAATLTTVSRSQMQTYSGGISATFKPAWSDYPAEVQKLVVDGVVDLFTTDLEPTLGRL